MNADRLNILWTNADPMTSELMVMMYATTAMNREYWGKVRVIIWGGTAKLVAESRHIQELISEAREAGVEFSACQSCAEQLGITETLRNLEVDMQFWGEPLTELIKANERLITI